MERFVWIAVLVSLVSAGRAAVAADTEFVRPELLTQDFRLPDCRGKVHTLADYQDHPIVVLAFLGTECPLAKLYAPRLNQLANEYKDRGVAFLGIHSNRQDSMAEIAAYAKQHALTFPMLKDAGNVVADMYQAERTPEVVVLDEARQIRYRGRVDDQYVVGLSRDKPEREDLREALEDLLAKREVRVPSTRPMGCLIGRQKLPVAGSRVTYSNQISRILQKHCVECHREGEIAPFSLTEYDEVAGWADMIQEVVETQRMPPWHANPEYGRFANERLLTAEEKRLLAEWVEEGAPLGDPSELPPPRQFTTGWRLPEPPHQVIAMSERPFTVQAEGTIDYQYFAVDPKFTEDKWVRATDLVPGNRAVVHHAIVFISPPAGKSGRGLGWLAAYVPGQSSMNLPDGQARFVPAGSKLIFQMHYTPNGSVQQDLTKIGLVFADASEVKEEVATFIAANGKLEIPPYAERHRVDLMYESLPSNGRLIALAPHMHVRGKSFRFIAHYPDGKSQILLDIPNYDFNWQNAYAFETPMEIPEGMRIECIAEYDNSDGNLANPDPSAIVRWGDQTWEEMMVAFFEVAIPVGQRANVPVKKEKELSPEQVQRAVKTANELLARFDKNGDGLIRRDEVPDTFRTFAFRRIDTDRDDTITLEEARQASLKTARRRK